MHTHFSVNFRLRPTGYSIIPPNLQYNVSVHIKLYPIKGFLRL